MIRTGVIEDSRAGAFKPGRDALFRFCNVASFINKPGKLSVCDFVDLDPTTIDT